MVAWQRAEVPESTTAITPKNSGAWTPWKRFLWFDHRKHSIDGSRQCFDNESNRSCAGAEGESLGGDLGSTALFFPQFIMSFKLMYTRMLQLLKWSSPQASHTAEMQRSGFLRHFPKETANVTSWSSPRFLHWNFLDNSVAYFPMPRSNPNYMFTQPTWNSGFDQCVFSFLDKSWFSNLRQSF